jgi:hypothetical protein
VAHGFYHEGKSFEEVRNPPYGTLAKVLIKTWPKVVVSNKGTLALVRGTLVNYEAREFKT